MKYLHIYKLLKAAGHDAAKAAEIVLDARRRDEFSRQWIGVLFHQRHR